MDPRFEMLIVEQKKQVHQLAADDVRPTRIRNVMSINAPGYKIPLLNKVQISPLIFESRNCTIQTIMIKLRKLRRTRLTAIRLVILIHFLFRAMWRQTRRYGLVKERPMLLFGEIYNEGLLNQQIRDPKGLMILFDDTFMLNQVDYPM
ncbi:hypothetical protein JG687_00015113 [Phytophthora cactorum]|uniref:Uncharacterized protein n=1 Tax=Phytophthora cactorum TaxID=29920 RepID=A0A8T1TYW1_9STRA|nr:hypothetical protein JG687_00015113 [Phytophthora cactorum]